MIKVGMLVEIVDSPRHTNKETRKFVGHIGRVIGESPYAPNKWYVEGAEWGSDGIRIRYSPIHLRPIRDDSDDIKRTRKEGHQDFNRFMSDIKTRKWEAV